MVAIIPGPVFFRFLVSQKLWAVDTYRRVPPPIDRGLAGRLAGRGGEKSGFGLCALSSDIQQVPLGGCRIWVAGGVCFAFWVVLTCLGSFPGSCSVHLGLIPGAASGGIGPMFGHRFSESGLDDREDVI